MAKGYDSGRWIFTGDTTGVSGQVKAIPTLPIVVMASDSKILRVIDRRQAVPVPQLAASKEVRERWNDYGIGLLLQGDLRGAESVFLKVTEMDPAYADGFVNVARCRIQVGDPAGAQAMLQQALTLEPALAKAHYFYGQTLKVLGRYDDALSHLRQAEARFPRDRAVLNEIGRVLFLQRRYDESVAALRRVLEVDPEDLQAHYNLMLAYRGAGKIERPSANRRCTKDQRRRGVTGDHRRLPKTKPRKTTSERQRIHEHGPALGRGSQSGSVQLTRVKSTSVRMRPRTAPSDTARAPKSQDHLSQPPHRNRNPAGLESLRHGMGLAGAQPHLQ